MLPIILGIVILLAIMGLCAGVSNDACNFMSAAVGTKSASYRAVTIIASVSVAIAFVFSVVIQWITRLIFTFNYKKNLGYKIGIFGGIATTALVYFMLIKGLRDASFINADIKSWIDANTGTLILGSFIFFSILMEILYFCKVNVLKVIVLIGTFALAMAFAGNDLVNFIGIPLSTTYVVFMVSMGASLADRAWSRESAVFRVTGVVAVIDEDIKKLRNIISQCKIEKTMMKTLKRKEIQMIRRLDGHDIFKKNTWFHLNYNCVEQTLYSLRRICEPCKEYVDNSFSPLSEDYVEELSSVMVKTLKAIDDAAFMLRYVDSGKLAEMTDSVKEDEDYIMEICVKQMNRIQNKEENIDLAVLYLNILQESMEIVTDMRHILRNTVKLNEKI